MNCIRCSAILKKVKLSTCPEPHKLVLEYRASNLYESNITTPADVWVCPQCGHVELVAQRPEVFKKI